MKQLTEEQIIANWDRYYKLIESTFTGDRKTKLLKMVDFFQDRMILAPASSKEHYHNAFPGGYIEHVLHVYDVAMDLKPIWAKYSGQTNYTDEEITLIALFHDLGKIGDEVNEFYMPQDNEWRRNTLGEIYKINPEIQNMNAADRSLYTLQKFGIELSQNEWITIKIHDGLYDEGNESYLKVMSDSNCLKSHLPHLIHQADIIAYRTEYEDWKYKYSQDTAVVQPKQKKYNTKKSLNETIKAPVLDNFYNETTKEINFDDLFEAPKDKEK